jgi:hypothetical protein
MIHKVQNWVYLLGLVGAMVFWLATMYGLPPRVDKLEIKVAEHEMRLNQNEVKLDIILDDVKTIKGFILHRHGGE